MRDENTTETQHTTQTQPDAFNTTSEPAPTTDLLQTPNTPDDLHVWLRDHLALTIPRTPIIPGHAAPFDYLIHTFFEGRGRRFAATRRSVAEAERDDADLSVPTADATPDCVVWANRGGGKTFLGAVATLLDLVFKPGIDIRILGGSMEQSKRMHAHLRNLFDPNLRPDLAALIDGRITDTRLRLKNGSTVELLAQSQTSVRGTRVQKLRCDEVDLFDRDVWEAAQLTTRSKRCGDWEVTGSVECLSTMHVPYGVMHDVLGEAAKGQRTLLRWGVVDVLERCGPEHSCHEPRPNEPRPSGSGCPQPPQAPVAHRPCPLLPECAGRAKERPANDSGHITISDAKSLKRRVAQSTWDSEMLCLRPRRTDSVLPEFTADRHVITALPQDIEASLIPPVSPRPRHLTRSHITWLAGMDFGWRSPTVILVAARSPDGTLTIVDERVTRGVVLTEQIAAIQSGLRPGVGALGEGDPDRDPLLTTGIPPTGWPKPVWIGADPAGDNAHEQTGTSNIETMRACGLIIRNRRMSLMEGLNLVRARLAPADASPPRLLIHARCTTLIKSLALYHFPADDPQSNTPVKTEGHDHAVDALRYLVQNLDNPFKTSMTRYVPK